MEDRAEVNSQHESDVGACAELAFDDSSATVLPELDSADIIPEAAMKCGILPLEGDLNDGLPTENLCLYFTILPLTTKSTNMENYRTCCITQCRFSSRLQPFYVTAYGKVQYINTIIKQKMLARSQHSYTLIRRHT